MQKKWALLLCFVLTGCASSPTIHEYCSSLEGQSHYRDYEQCYAAQTAQNEARMRMFMQMQQNNNAMSQSMQQGNSNALQSYQNYLMSRPAPISAPTQTNCTSNASGGTLYTNCLSR